MCGYSYGAGVGSAINTMKAGESDTFVNWKTAMSSVHYERNL